MQKSIQHKKSSSTSTRTKQLKKQIPNNERQDWLKVSKAMQREMEWFNDKLLDRSRTMMIEYLNQ